MTQPASKPVAPALPGYWKAYGGIKALLKSPFPYLAAVVTGLCYPFWMKDGWWNLVTTVLPCILGFTIAAFTLVLGLGGDVFRRQLHRPNSRTGVPLYLKISAIFAHQIIVQTLAVVFAIVLAGVWMWPAPDSDPWAEINHWALQVSWGLGFFLFVYSVLLVFAGALNIFTLAKMIQRAALKESRTKTCPHCREEINPEATKCKHCGSRLPDEAKQPASA
ncbi:hypothetical protein [Paraburkholderia sediminicola]|uniref:hypothetical protein n=1 Tax=Paraburkholderia sediminicola TaxID=458836 RepID=UPI0038B92C81